MITFLASSFLVYELMLNILCENYNTQKPALLLVRFNLTKSKAGFSIGSPFLKLF